MYRLFASAVLLAAVAGAVAVVAGSGRAQPAGKTVTLVARNTETSIHFLDTAPKSPSGQPDHTSPGDVILQTSVLRNSAGRRVGTRYTELTFYTASQNAGSVVLDQSLYVLGDGQIAEEAINGPGAAPAAAITGGSGAYAAASGTESTSNGKDAQTFHIRLLP